MIPVTRAEGKYRSPHLALREAMNGGPIRVSADALVNVLFFILM
jgi:hypothetical protein